MQQCLHPQLMKHHRYKHYQRNQPEVIQQPHPPFHPHPQQLTWIVIFEFMVRCGLVVRKPIYVYQLMCHPTTGDQFSFSSDIWKAYSSLDYFLLMFMLKQLQETVRLTKIKLQDKSGLDTTPGEILKWISVLILSTRYEFDIRRKLSSRTLLSKYIPAPSFGKTGMSRNRFDTLWENVRSRYQPAVRPDGMSSERYRWMFVDGFGDRINDYRQNSYVPSQDICVDDLMSRW